MTLFGRSLYAIRSRTANAESTKYHFNFSGGPMNMFCNQCEQTARGTGCTLAGVCGKQPATAGIHDVLFHQLKGIGWCSHELRKLGCIDDEADRFMVEGLFTLVTNVNFDDSRIASLIERGGKIRDGLVEKLKAKDPLFDAASLPESVRFVPASSMEGLLAQAPAFTFLTSEQEDIRSLKQLLTFGIRGMAAYAHHARILGKKDETVTAFFHESLTALNDSAPSLDELVAMIMKCGTVNIRCMELLDQGHTERYGHPEPATVSTGTRKGPAIVVTGHDLFDLEALLRQTEGTGVNVYTHGEMLPAHGYPGLRKHSHLAGHFGTAWQNQQREFDGVPAAFLFTTNCIQKPGPGYIDRVFTTGLVGWPGVAHVENHDFSAVIAKAKDLGGFPEAKGGMLTTGFGRNAVLGVADKVVDAVKSGKIKHFFLVGGCDGAKPGRSYYTDFAQAVPGDCVILTLACGKYRFNHLDFGTIDGIPRLLDIGQCNDAYSAIRIAQALAGAFSCDINDLPLSLILSWYEQKAVVILLSLLSLGIRRIRIGPSLPAFISPNVLALLVEKFDLKSIGTVHEDLAAILG